MKVTIWDLDYYYAKDKRNCFNPDIMRISSYHKQMGDEINFVETKYDIYRPFDLYYIFKENDNTPNPPLDLIMNNKVKWGGKCYRIKKNWVMTDLMRAARPDYLIYPNKDTRTERAAQIYLMTEKNTFLAKRQDWYNTFGGNKVLIVDKNMWFASPDEILKALKSLEGIKNLSFLEPIWIEKIISNKEIRDEFFKLNLHYGANFKWRPLNLKYANNIEEAVETLKKHIDFIKEVKNTFLKSSSGRFQVYIPDVQNFSNYKDWFYALLNIMVDARKNKVKLEIEISTWRDNPYFFLFNEISGWSKRYTYYSWLEYLTVRFAQVREKQKQLKVWNHPERWSVHFRDLLRQTLGVKDFILIKWGNKRVSENDIPWNVWKETFKFGI